VRFQRRDRIAALLSVLALAALAAFTAFLAERAGLDEAAGPRLRQPDEPDYFVERFSLTRLDERGDPTFRMSAQRLEHFPADDSSVITRPVLVSLDPGRPRVTLSAERGRAQGRSDETLLEGNVVLTRAATAGSASLRLSTDAVVLYNGREIARTDRPVRIEQGASVLTGVGMEFNNPARTLQLFGSVRGLWVGPGNSRALPSPSSP
jgi:lipopolysaccharide export system protein LptC